MVKYLSFHNSSFALRYFFMQMARPLCATPLVFLVFFLFQFLDIENLVNFSRKIETSFEFTVGKKESSQLFLVKKDQQNLSPNKNTEGCNFLNSILLSGSCCQFGHWEKLLQVHLQD
jgi:hypothetical protein